MSTNEPRVAKRGSERLFSDVNTGPMHVPKWLLDTAKYHYRFMNLDDRTPYSFDYRLDLGYEHVTIKEMDEARRAKFGDILSNRKMSIDGINVCVKINQHITGYLMKLPIERYEVLDRENKRNSKELLDSTKQKSSRDGDYTTVSDELINPNKTF